MDPKTQKISQFVPEKIFEGGAAQWKVFQKLNHTKISRKATVNTIYFIIVTSSK